MEQDSRNLSLLWMFADELTADCWERSRVHFAQLGVYAGIRYARMLLHMPGTHTNNAAVRARSSLTTEEDVEEVGEEYDRPLGEVWNKVAQHWGYANVRL